MIVLRTVVDEEKECDVDEVIWHGNILTKG